MVNNLLKPKRHKIGIIELATMMTLVAVYIIPTGLVDTQYQISKYFFVGSIFVLYIFYCSQNKRINKKELVMIIFLFIETIFSRNANFLVFITLPFAEIIALNKDRITAYLKQSKILYICVAFTAIYSFGCYLFLPTPGNEDHIRLIRTAIIEINQSGLAIFCLGIMLKRKNKRMANIILAAGLLTESRSYYLALVIYVLSKNKIIKQFIKKIKIKKWTYFRITLITNVLLFFIGYLYINLFQQGFIIPYDSTNKTFSLNDYSNFFRFSLIVFLCNIFIKNPKFLLLGLSDEEYIKRMNQTALKIYKVPYRGNKPHNLFFSHLQKYGLFSFVEAYFVSLVCKRITNNNNFGIYISIIMYSILLGAGMYSYWLYLSFFTLIMEM